MNNLAPSIDCLFQPLIGIPAWNVRKGYGSFLTFEFGTPSLKIREPQDAPGASPRVHQRLQRRQITLRGEWHLWVYCCGWRITAGTDQLAHNASTDDEIAAACLQLDGQSLQKVTCFPENGHTRFCFDLGGVLETGPYDEELKVQWILDLPDGNVYTYRSDGAASFGRGNSNEDKWMQIG